MQPFMNLFRHPIMQAPIGSACSLELVRAVTNAGGIGSFAITWHTPEQAVACVEELNATTQGAYAINYVCTFECPSLPQVLEAGVPIMTLSWGMPKLTIKRIKATNTVLGLQVGSPEGAKAAADLGADFIICQGFEAGGHVQSSTPLIPLLESVGALDLGVPLVGTGGIADACDVQRVLSAGASVAALGTRFLAASESAAHPDYKQAILAATDDDAVFTVCFDGDWPYAGSRVLRNRTLVRWEAAGCPPIGQRPGENDLIATTQSGFKVPRYHIASPVNTTRGNLLDLALYAGTSSGRINRVADAADIVAELSADL